MLLQNHEAEIQKSVPSTELGQKIISLNFWSIQDSRDFDMLFGWNQDQRRRHSDMAPGWCVRGVDPKTGESNFAGAQYKADRPRQTSDGKTIKYESCKGGESYPLFLDNGDPEYWVRIREALGMVIWITEGAKKAACLMAHGRPAISLPGVWNGAKKGWLITKLKRWLRPGMTIALAFDSDWKTKEGVRKGMMRLGALLQKEGISVLIPTWSEGKGIDDYVMGLPESERDRTLSQMLEQGQALSFSEWVDSVKSLDQTITGAKLNAEECACKIVEEMEQVLRFNTETDQWMLYGHKFDGLWSHINDVKFGGLVSEKIKEFTGKVSKNKTNETIFFLRQKLEQEDWRANEAVNLLPFRNGVLDLTTGEFSDHDPDNLLTWQIPRNHDRDANDWSAVQNWMQSATRNDRMAIKTLLCFINCVLKGRYELQKYLHLTGDGGTGKGTFINLITALIGDESVVSTSLRRVCEGNFEAANFYGKRLVVFPDQLPFNGAIDSFLNLTGGDKVTGEIKGGKRFDFRFEGMTLMASNKPVFPGQSASAINRRVRMLPFEVQVADADRDPFLIKKLTDEKTLAALINFCLTIPDEEVQRIMFGLQTSNEMNCRSWEYRMREDSIAAWLNDRVIYDPGFEIGVGNNKQDEDSLFGSYWKYCEEAGLKSKSSVKFSPEVEEVCRRVLGWDVTRDRKNNRSIMRGLRLREPGDAHIPTHLDELGNRQEHNLQESADSVWAKIWPNEPETPAEASTVEQPETQAEQRPPLLQAQEQDKSETRVGQEQDKSETPTHPLPNGTKVILRIPTADGLEGTIVSSYENPVTPGSWCYSVQNCSARHEALQHEVVINHAIT